MHLWVLVVWAMLLVCIYVSGTMGVTGVGWVICVDFVSGSGSDVR